MNALRLVGGKDSTTACDRCGQGVLVRDTSPICDRDTVEHVCPPCYVESGWFDSDYSLNDEQVGEHVAQYNARHGFP